MSKFTVICTGQPGTGRDEYLQQLKGIKEFSYYHLFEYIVDEAEKQGFILNKLNVLDFYDSKPGLFEDFRAEALNRIRFEIEGRDGIHIISTPHHFEWKGKSYTGIEKDEISSLNPNLFLVIIDDLVRVRERLRNDPQWKDHNFTLVELSQWRREEITGIYNLCREFNPHKQFYVVAKEHGISLLEDLVFNRYKKKIYLSHPITGQGIGFFEKVGIFANKLQAYYTIFDPYMIKDWELVEKWRNVRNEEMIKGAELPEQINITIQYSDGERKYKIDSWDIEAAIKNLRAQIIDIDYKTIESSSHVVAYHPREQLSAGVLCEMVQAKGLAKFVYVFYPFEPSPFFEWYSTKIFSKEEEMLGFLGEIAGKEEEKGDS